MTTAIKTAPKSAYKPKEPAQKMVRFVESLPAIGRVDENLGIIYGARVLGLFSKNGYRYSVDALREAVPLYRSVKVYLNHQSEQDKQDGNCRNIQDWIGTIENPRFVGDCLRGDIHMIKSHPMTSAIIESAGRLSKRFGLSQSAFGRLEETGTGDRVINRISAVDSVDIVTDPATSEGLFEAISKITPMKPPAKPMPPVPGTESSDLLHPNPDQEDDPNPSDNVIDTQVDDLLSELEDVYSTLQTELPPELQPSLVSLARIIAQLKSANGDQTDMSEVLEAVKGWRRTYDQAMANKRNRGNRPAVRTNEPPIGSYDQERQLFAESIGIRENVSIGVGIGIGGGRGSSEYERIRAEGLNMLRPPVGRDGRPDYAAHDVQLAEASRRPQTEYERVRAEGLSNLRPPRR